MKDVTRHFIDRCKERFGIEIDNDVMNRWKSMIQSGLSELIQTGGGRETHLIFDFGKTLPVVCFWHGEPKGVDFVTALHPKWVLNRNRGRTYEPER